MIQRGDGRKVVAAAGTAQALDTSQEITEIIVTAETDNTGVIVVGSSSVVAALATRRGTPLNAGQSVVVADDNIDQIFIDATVTGDGVTYQWMKERNR